MKILILNWRDPTHPWAGGAEVYLYELALRWAQWGHQITWYSGRHPDQPASERMNGIEMLRRGGFYGVYLRFPGCYLARLAGRFDVILDSANGIPFFTPLYSRIPKVALVHHVHRQVFYYELPRPLAKLADFLERVAMPRVYQNVPFICVSKSTKRGLVELGIPAEKISLIHNGVDSRFYRPAPCNGDPHLLFLGRLRNYKSVDIAIRALPHLKEALPGVRLSIAGSGPSERHLRGLARQLDVDDRVHFHGWVTQAEKLRLLQGSRLVVHPSMREGWGLTVLEANACGKPVVGADVPGLRDSICHDHTGLLVKYGDPEALADGVLRLLEDKNHYQRLGQNALAWARGFDWEVSARNGLDVLAAAVRQSHE
jgi:glycosyltransferase involved in cell wall biosynthesis